MAYSITFRAPEGWKSDIRTETDDNGIESVILEASNADSEIQINVCDMPGDESAEDQAFANYVEMIGFDEDEENAENPIVQFTFDGKKAYGFAAYDEQEHPMRLFTQEPRRGMLVIYYMSAPTIEKLNAAQDIIERSVRVKSI